MNLKKIFDSYSKENFTGYSWTNDEFEKNYCSKDDAFRYSLLDRMKGDCEYYLGNGGKYAKYLWAGDEKDQIKCMVSLWNSFEEKPEWISKKDIENYCEKICGTSIENL